MQPEHAGGTTSPGRLLARARWLAYATIVWNVVEAVVAIAAGSQADSQALIGFGVDSTIETASAVVVLWRLKGTHAEREPRALWLIGLSFFVLAGYVAFESIRDLVGGDEPSVSGLGIAITGLSLVVMPLLARAKQRVGHAIDSQVVLADAVETWLCTYLSATVLVGLLANAALGWWWADPVAALGVAYLAFQEGREAWEDGDDDDDDAVEPVSAAP